MAPALTVDRESFIAWTQSILLDFSDGCGVIGDHVDHPRAKRLLDDGQTVQLTVDSRPFSMLRLVKGKGYVETKL